MWLPMVGVEGGPLLDELCCRAAFVKTGCSADTCVFKLPVFCRVLARVVGRCNIPHLDRH